jgi:hypothetical protein
VDDLDEARALLPGVELSAMDTLGGSQRSSVRRARAAGLDGRRTVIVKTFTDIEGWVRESAALAVLPPKVPAPRLVASGATPPVVIMSDLGGGTSVADALLGTDPAQATRAVDAWVDAIAALHRETLGLRERFAAELAGRAPSSAITTWFDQSLEELRTACAPMGVAVPPSLVDLWRSQLVRLSEHEASALSPADACPDNNVFTPDGLALIDFEGAEWRHIAWDVAYLRVPWPSCWCAWRLPEEVSDRAVARYRTAMAPHLAYVTTPEFDRDVATAGDLWIVVYSAFFLPAALGDDPPPRRPGLNAPQRRAFLLHRLDLVQRTSPTPETAAFAGTLRTALVDRWGEVELALAPAFR